MAGIKDLAAKTAGVTARAVEKASGEREPRTAPVRMYDITSRMHQAEERAEELAKKLEEAIARSTTALELSLDDLVEVPGRKRQLTQEEKEELRENLRRNPLTTPITVRPIGNGKYEIISGHNRTDTYRELGRSKIPAFIQEVDAAQADLNAFFANLLHPALPDYQKYQGFIMIKAKQPDLTHDEIADRAGVSRAQVTRLMAFSSLPREALQAIETNPHAIGANAAGQLASLASAGKADAVTAAVQDLVAGKINQDQAVKMASAKPMAKKKADAKEEVKIKAGKSAYCSLRRTQNVVRVEFKELADAEGFEDELIALLDKYAKLKASKA